MYKKRKKKTKVSDLLPLQICSGTYISRCPEASLYLLLLLSRFLKFCLTLAEMAAAGAAGGGVRWVEQCQVSRLQRNRSQRKRSETFAAREVKRRVKYSLHEYSIKTIPRTYRSQAFQITPQKRKETCKPSMWSQEGPSNLLCLQ